jgi:Domain of unknown function (DUF2019)
MNPKDLSHADIEELTTAYAKAASEHGAATAAGNPDRANECHDMVASVYRELRARGPDAQRALLPLIGYADDAVRYWAASHALEFAPDQGEPVLAELARSRGLSAFNAKMTLREWQKGNLSFP